MMHIPVKAFNFIIILLSFLLLTACGGGQTLRGVLKKETPYEHYTSAITSANLHKTALGRTWIEAGQKALQDSVQVMLPFKETGYFAADEPRAAAYTFNARRGEKVIITVETRTNEHMQLFMDLFQVVQPGTAPAHLAYADTTTTGISFEVQEDARHLLRLQPELLRGGQYTLTIQIEPTLAFPVPGKSSRHISSIWGDPRDAGARRHEGVDIFAPRGTPVIASAAGIVRGVSTNPRGGKVIWLLDMERRQSLYYAHLDSQLVAPGQQVQVGDTIGLIGNTGNASTTAPHLHFGIYRFGKGATNPHPYLHQSGSKPSSVKSELTVLGSWRRISAQNANMRLMPSAKGSTTAITLPRHTPLRILGATDTWYRVQLPNGFEGYVATGVTESITKAIRQEKLTTSVALLDKAHAGAAAKDSLKAGRNVAVLASYHNFRLVQIAEGITGWLGQP